MSVSSKCVKVPISRNARRIWCPLWVLVAAGVSAGATRPPSTTPASSNEALPPGFVRGEVVSYSYVPIRQWTLEEGIGKLPYLFEYDILKDGGPRPENHTENVRRIDIASQWSTAIKLSIRDVQYLDEVVNLMIRCFRRRQLIVLGDYYSKKENEQYSKVRALLDRLWDERETILTNPEGDTATGRQLINNTMACKLGDEGLCGLGTDGLARVYEEFNRRVRYREREGEVPFRHIRGWYNMLAYPAIDFRGCFASSQEDVDKHGRHKLPANTQFIGVDTYHFWGHKWSPFDPADPSVSRQAVRAHSDEWQRIRTKYYPEGCQTRVCENSHDPATWVPECFSDTHALLNGIRLAGAGEAMMWYIGCSGQIKGRSYTTPAETMDAYYDSLKAGPWVGLCWWIFSDYQEGGGGSLFEGGLRLYDKDLKHYTPEHPEGIPYSDEMLEKLRQAYIACKMRMFNDVVHNQFGHLNGPAR